MMEYRAWFRRLLLRSFLKCKKNRQIINLSFFLMSFSELEYCFIFFIGICWYYLAKSEITSKFFKTANELNVVKMITDIESSSKVSTIKSQN